MSGNFSYSRDQRIYLQLEGSSADYGLIPGFPGPVTLAGSNACKLISSTLDPDVQLITRPDKNGLRSAVIDSAGHKTCQWSVDMSLAPGSGAGVVPDSNPLWVSWFGAAPVIVAGTSVTYSLSDLILSLSLWRYRTPSTLVQMVAIGAICKQFQLQLGQDVSTVKFSGPALWGMDSEEYATLADGDLGKGGLTSAGQAAFPPEPGSPVTNGNMIVGYKGLITVGGSTIAQFQEGTITGDNGSSIQKAFGSDYYIIPVAGSRKVGVALKMYDGDSAGQIAVRAAAKSKAPTDIVIQVGNVVGAKYGFTLKNVQLQSPKITEQGDFMVMDLPESPSHLTSSTPNEIQLAIT
jgi:tail tube protein